MDINDIKKPYPMRFSLNERAIFKGRANKLDLSVPNFFRLIGLHEDLDDQIIFLQNQINLRSENAKLLAAFGKGRTSSSLNQIAKHMNMGTFELTPDVVSEIHFICETNVIAKQELFKLQGLKV